MRRAPDSSACEQRGARVARRGGASPMFMLELGSGKQAARIQAGSARKLARDIRACSKEFARETRHPSHSKKQTGAAGGFPAAPVQNRISLAYCTLAVCGLTETAPFLPYSAVSIREHRLPFFDPPNGPQTLRTLTRVVDRTGDRPLAGWP